MKTLLEPSNIASSGTKAFFTTKLFNDKDDSILIALARELNIPQGSVYLPVQKHTDKIHVLENGNEPVIADAVVTKRKKMLIGVLVADCVPVLLHDRACGVIGAVHAGWRGTALKIVINTIKTMQRTFNSSVRDISVAIGPSIRECSYEVGEEVTLRVRKATGGGNYCRKQADKYFIDLSTANKIQAINAGIPEENIWQSGECTFCNPERYYSYRFSKGTTGRQGGFIGMW